MIVWLERSQPLPVPVAPAAAWARVLELASQQESREAMTAAHQIRPGRLTAARQITELLLLDRWDAHERQLAGQQRADQPLGVTPVGLDPLPRLARDRTRRTDPHLDPCAAASRASPYPVGPPS